MRVIEVPALKERLAPTIAATEKEFQEAMSIGAANMASLLIVHLLAIVSREFKLDLDKEIGELTKEVEAYAKRHTDAIRKAAGIKEGSKGSA